MATIPPGKTLPPIFRADHTINVRVQHFTGNGKQGPGTGFAWSARELTDDETIALGQLLSAVDENLGVETSRAAVALADENTALRRQNEKFRAALKIAANEIRRLSARR